MYVLEFSESVYLDHRQLTACLASRHVGNAFTLHIHLAARNSLSYVDPKRQWIALPFTAEDRYMATQEVSRTFELERKPMRLADSDVSSGNTLNPVGRSEGM